MFLRARTRKKDGKEHRYVSVVENKRVSGGRVLQRHVLYLGEINSSQEIAWRRSIEVLDEGTQAVRTLALFPEDGCEAVVAEESIVRLKLAQLRLERPRQWGACWLALQLWQQLKLDAFWRGRLAPSRKGTRFDQVLVVNRWRDLFNASFDVLLYDLTSTYFESDPPEDEQDKRRYGYSRDHRPDCVQVLIALVVTPTGLPLAYEVLAGNTRDCTTRKDFLARIERQYGKARRVWCMDRGIPTEEVLAQMRTADPPVHYLVGTPKGRLTRLEQALLDEPWHAVRPGVQVKLLAQDAELYVLAESRDRVAKERSMRCRQLKWLWARLNKLSTMSLTRDELLMKLGAAHTKTPAAWRLIAVEVAKDGAHFTYRLDRDKLWQVRRREGRHLLRSNLPESDPAKLWQFYLQLVEVEAAFRTLKGDLAIRPVFHQDERRIEAHIFIAFLAYCLHVTLGQQLKVLAPGLTPRSVLDKFATVQMIDVYVPTTDGPELSLTRYTQPEAELKLLLEKLKLTLPAQAPPKIAAHEPHTP